MSLERYLDTIKKDYDLKKKYNPLSNYNVLKRRKFISLLWVDTMKEESSGLGLLTLKMRLTPYY